MPLLLVSNGGLQRNETRIPFVFAELPNEDCGGINLN